MKKQRLGLWIAIAIGFLSAGCPPAEEAQVQAVKEKIAAGKKVSGDELVAVLDDSKLPPPPEALEDTPDLYRARFRITDRSLQLIGNGGVSSDIMGKLATLKDRNFSNTKTFVAEVERVLGLEAARENREIIMASSLVMDLDVEPPFPGAELKVLALSPVESSSGFSYVYFDFDRAEIRPEFLGTVQNNARILKENSEMKVVIEGHCDERGSTEYNLALGERRAKAIEKALISYGVDPNQLQTISYGEERPLDYDHVEAAWAKNRRTALVKIR